jgi:predicted nucleic acid-binding protein
MILLDTNVVSETTKLAPEKSVIDWLDGQIAESLYLSTVSLAELHLGIALLPDGRRKTALRRSVTQIIADLFGSRIVAFDVRAALAFSEIMSAAQRSGQRIGLADGQIAAIAHTNGMIVATRDTDPFKVAGMTVINPWIAA